MMSLTRRLLLVVALWSVDNFVLALDPADLPADAASDAIMATPGEVAEMADWAGSVFAGRMPRRNASWRHL